MLNRFWGTYQSIVFKKCFFEEHQRRSEILLFWAKVICAAVSILSVLAWSVSKSLPALWASLIALAQLAQTMLGYIPWAQQLNALCYLLPDLNLLIADLDADWLRLSQGESEDPAALTEKSAFYERKYFELENRFTVGVWFPVTKSVVAAAETSRKDYFRVRYSNEEGCEKNADSAESEPAAESGQGTA